MSKNIVILGGGFGGLRTALELSRRRDFLGDHQIVLVDRTTHHLYTPLLYEVASAFLQNVTPAEEFCMRNGVCADFAFLQKVALDNAVRFMQGNVTAIDLKRQTVTVGKEKLPYAYLVVALGSTTEDFGIPGIREYGYMFKRMDDAMAIHERIHTLLTRKQKGKEEKVTIVIGGGGPTGVELAAEVASFCMRCCAKYDLRFTDFQVTLIEAGSRLLRGIDPTVSAWAKERLLHLGVELWLDTCVKKVTKGSAVIAPRPLYEGEHSDALLCDFRGEHDKTIEADVFIWSGGIRAPEVLQKSGLLLDVKGRVDVHDTLAAKGVDHVFAIGDCSVLVDPRTNRTLPGLAQVAVYEGVLAAENIRRAIAGRHLHSYTFPTLFHLIPAGGKYALGEFGSFHFRGFFMWILRRLVDLRYFLSILPLRHALRTWFDGWRMYTKND